MGSCGFCALKFYINSKSTTLNQKNKYVESHSLFHIFLQFGFWHIMSFETPSGVYYQNWVPPPYISEKWASADFILWFALSRSAWHSWLSQGRKWCDPLVLQNVAYTNGVKLLYRWHHSSTYDRFLWLFWADFDHIYQEKRSTLMLVYVAHFHSPLCDR